MKKIIILTLLLLTLLTILAIFSSCKRVTQTEYNVDKNSCQGCGECVRTCPYDAIYMDSSNKAAIDHSKCRLCGKCVLVCPNNAIY